MPNAKKQFTLGRALLLTSFLNVSQALCQSGEVLVSCNLDDVTEGEYNAISDMFKHVRDVYKSIVDNTEVPK